MPRVASGWRPATPTESKPAITREPGDDRPVLRRKNPDALLIISSADLGEADPTRIAVEKANAKPILERLNVGRHGAR